MKNAIKRLSWDSEFFGYEVGKIEIYNQEDIDIIAFHKEAQAFKLVYVFSNLELNLLNFHLVDKKVIFHQKIDEIFETKDIIIESFNIEKHDFNQLRQLALESGAHSRFIIDKNFTNNEYCNLFSQWIENSVKKINSFDVILAVSKDTILGFATLNRKNATLSDIGLVAVSKTSRGLGIGKKLINESIIKSKKAGFNEIQVVTQLDNIAAVCLYKSSNFKIKKVTNIYHFWNI